MKTKIKDRWLIELWMKLRYHRKPWFSYRKLYAHFESPECSELDYQGYLQTYEYQERMMYRFLAKFLFLLGIVNTALMIAILLILL